MKQFFIVVFVIFSAACSMQVVESQKSLENPQSPIPNTQTKSPVLVELFTSEGCSSCPPADRALAFLDREQPYGQAEIITLAWHVDYWNYLGWKDEFSSPLFSQRQESYAQKFKLDSVYTPQMVVDGQKEFVGSSSGQAVSAVMEAASAPKAKIETSGDAEKLKINISDLPEHENATVFLAIAEDDLSSDVRRGENSGQKLQHQSVVRELKTLGSLGAGQRSLELEIPVEKQTGWKAENLKFVIFVQENNSRKIIGLTRRPFGNI